MFGVSLARVCIANVKCDQRSYATIKQKRIATKTTLKNTREKNNLKPSSVTQANKIHMYFKARSIESERGTGGESLGLDLNLKFINTNY